MASMLPCHCSEVRLTMKVEKVILRPGDSSATCKKISLLALGKSLKRAEEWFTHLYYLELGALTLILLKISNRTTY